MPRIGRPPGRAAFWTNAERELVREAFNKLIEALPHRTPRAIANMILRMESGEV